MKQIFTSMAFAALIMLASCDTIEPTESFVEGVSSGVSSGSGYSHAADSIVFTASLGTETKTYLDNNGYGYDLLWSESDEIFIMDAATLTDDKPIYESCRLIDGAGTTAAEFIGTMKADSYVALYSMNYGYPDSSGRPVVSIYPYQYSETYMGEENIQDYHFPMVAVSDDRNFEFQNLGSILKLNVTGDGEFLDRIYVSTKNGEAIAGYASIDFDSNDDPYLIFTQEPDGRSVFSSIEYFCYSTYLSSTPEEFYIIVPAQVYEDGIEFTLITDDGRSMSVSTAAGIKTERSKMHEISIDFVFEPDPNALPDGVYIVGDAVGSANGTEAHAFTMTCTDRYDKFVALNGEAAFTIVKWENGVKTEYASGGYSRYRHSETGYEFDYSVLTEISSAESDFAVWEAGLYYIIVNMEDFEVVILPVNWDIRGTCNSWGSTPMEYSFDLNSMTFRMENIPFTSSNASFKFCYSGLWGIADMLNHSIDNWISTNLGIDSFSGNIAFDADNINLTGAPATYNIELTWRLGTGFLNDFDYSTELVQELTSFDYSECQFELVGTSVGGGSADPSSWSWGNVLLADNSGYPTFDGTTYTYTWSSAYLLSSDQSSDPGFKIRTINAQSSGGIAADYGFDKVDTDNSSAYVTTIGYMSNICVSETGYYNIVMTINSLTNEVSITIK